MGTRIFACHVIPVPLFLRGTRCTVVFGGTTAAPWALRLILLHNWHVGALFRLPMAYV